MQIRGSNTVAQAFYRRLGFARLCRVARHSPNVPETPRDQVSFSGKIHGVAFLVGVPCQHLAVLLLSLALRNQAARTSLQLLTLTAVVWLSIVVVIEIMLMVGGKSSNPNGPERFLGWPNRLFMVSYGMWLVVAAWPMTPWRR
jgi:hypothetical protein